MDAQIGCDRKSEGVTSRLPAGLTPLVTQASRPLWLVGHLHWCLVGAKQTGPRQLVLPSTIVKQPCAVNTVTLCAVTLCAVTLCAVTLCAVTLCAVTLCAVTLCEFQTFSQKTLPL
ncbi:hypothetical protein RRG08_043677 [Elysia crispata]|uniref:Uncharacterized protein n=1 Tax=Elysia crispata TaxID=231223 RepID=A0AAE0ZWK9_9GAST|nr:hypothetical protein RRG08_043677 [Elysia crispata]